jgi:hypothetical protein
MAKFDRTMPSEPPPTKSFGQVVADGTAKVSGKVVPPLARRMAPKGKPMPTEAVTNDGPVSAMPESRGSEMVSLRARGRKALEARDVASAVRR